MAAGVEMMPVNQEKDGSLVIKAEGTESGMEIMIILWIEKRWK